MLVNTAGEFSKRISESFTMINKLFPNLTSFSHFFRAVFSNISHFKRKKIHSPILKQNC